MNGGPLSLLIVFGLSLLLGVFIFILGRRSIAKSSTVHDGGGTFKFIPYSCGENFFHDVGSRINLERFMIYAIYFLIFDVAGFILAISFNLLVLAVITYAIIALASIMLVAKR